MMPSFLNFKDFCPGSLLEGRAEILQNFWLAFWKKRTRLPRKFIVSQKPRAWRLDRPGLIIELWEYLLTDYCWFMSLPFNTNCFPTGSFYGFHFSTIFMFHYFHFHFFIVEFSLFWNDLLAENAYWFPPDSRQELRISWYWRKIWRNMENVNKFNFREQQLVSRQTWSDLWSLISDVCSRSVTFHWPLLLRWCRQHSRQSLTLPDTLSFWQ